VESCEDWECSLDDQGPEYWEDYLGGPDESAIESYYENLAQDYEDEHHDDPLECDEDESEGQEMEEEENQKPISRKQEIVNWLCESKLARKFRNREGFFVPRGPHVRLKDGSVVDLLDWLFDEGIKGGMAVAGYSVAHSKPGSEYGEKLSFFKIVVDAPFLPRSGSNKETEFDDDIPF